MMITLRRAAVTLVLTMMAFSAGLAAGNALASTPGAGTSRVPATIGGAPKANGPTTSPRCSPTLGPEDYETCKVYFGE